MSGADTRSTRKAGLAAIGVDDLTFAVRSSTFRFAITTMRRTPIPLATEYAVRLIHQVPDLTADDIAAFFGFGVAETLVLIQDVLETGMVVESQGCFKLSAKGQIAVSELGDIELFAINEQNTQQTFDLVSFAPITDDELGRSGSRFSLELTLPDRRRAANAADEVKLAFEVHFQEWLDLVRKKSDDVRFRSIEDIQQIKTFAAPVSTRMLLRTEGAATVDADYREMRTRGQHGSRDPLIQAMGASIQTVTAPADHDWAFNVLNDVDGGVLRRAGIAGTTSAPAWIGANPDRYTDRDDTPNSTNIVVGSVTGDLPKHALLEMARGSGGDSTGEPVLWLPPVMNHWGRSIAFESLLGDLQQTNDDIVLLPRSDMSERDLRNLAWRHGPSNNGGRYDRGLALRSGSPEALEVIVKPGVFGMALVHAPDGGSGFPLPFGYATTDPAIVKELTLYLSYLATDARTEHVLWSRPEESKTHCLAAILTAARGY